MAGVVGLLGLGSIWQGFQPTPPEAWGRFQFAADLLGSIEVGGTKPLFFLMGAYLLFEAVRMTFAKRGDPPRD